MRAAPVCPTGRYLLAATGDRNPFTGRAATDLASIAVVGEHLTTVYAYATAAFAMGEAARDCVEALDG